MAAAVSANTRVDFQRRMSTGGRLVLVFAIVDVLLQTRLQARRTMSSVSSKRSAGYV